MQKRDLLGQRFGSLTVIAETSKRVSGQVVWLCKCDCGNESLVKMGHLIDGTTKSCGCKQRTACITHGKTYTRIYHIWCTMKARCYRESCIKYSKYGGRGIVMCEEWRNDFSEFYNWSMEHGYNDSLSIDRIDNNKGYYPDNCRWATASEQANNTSTNRRFVFEGKDQTVAEIARSKCIKPSRIYKRLRRGQSIEDAVASIIGSTGR